MTRRFAVVGHPIAHSLSPRIHALFADSAGIPIGYQRLLAPLDDFVGTVERFVADGGAGFNVTLPFKEQAFAWVDAADRYATRARAVNTVVVDSERRGFNTDGLGLLRDLESLGQTVRARRILIVGAGGAARGVLDPLLDQAPAQIVIANRTPARAEQLVVEFGDPRLRAVPFEAVRDRFDIVINGTSASLSADVPALPAHAVSDSFCYDMAYGARPTAFCDWAHRHGAAQVADGLGMLVEQAALAFELWHGVLPETVDVRTRLRSEITIQ
jgi:shikimate dehydrogenase